jgi:hypothetical protein
VSGGQVLGGERSESSEWRLCNDLMSYKNVI